MDSPLAQAQAWLDGVAGDWYIRQVDSTLRAGPAFGSPTERTVTVVIASRKVRDDRFLRAEGGTIMEAVQAAFGIFEEVSRGA